MKGSIRRMGMDERMRETRSKRKRERYISEEPFKRAFVALKSSRGMYHSRKPNPPRPTSRVPVQSARSLCIFYLGAVRMIRLYTKQTGMAHFAIV
jgi:hypothetical protein